MIDNVFKKRPYSQRSYESTLRLLITSRCQHNCFFCHNEGQDKSVQHDMDFDKILPYLKTLKKRFNSITVSGGEPLLHPDLDKIIHSLSNYNFDLTLDTFGITPKINHEILELLKSLHVTFLCLGSKGIYAKEVDNSKIEMLTEIHKHLPRLNLCINIPFVRPETQSNNFSDILGVARQLNSKIKFISEYDCNISRIDDSQPWASRWEYILPLLNTNDFTLSDVNTREVEYIDKDGVIVELSDIACVNVDQGYGNGICFKNSDLTIQPDLSVKLCRWQNNRISLEELLENDSIDNDFLGNLIKTSSSQCPYKIQSHPLINKGLAHYLLNKHYTWPLRDNTHGLNDKIKDITEMTISSYFGSSGSVRRLETQFAKRVNTKYAVAVNSGASSLSLAYKAVGIKAGSEVIIPVLTYPGAATPLLQIGANIRLCDVDESTGNISISCLEKLVSKNTKAVVVTHLWGNPVDMQRLSKVCKQHDIKIVEDASHAFNAKIDNKAIGSWGDVACFSLQANKAICAGEGGIISTNKKDIFEFVIAHCSLKKQILDSISSNNVKSIWETGLGVKQKIHPYAASMGLVYLELFDLFKKLKDERLSIVTNKLKDIPYLKMSPQVPCSEREYYTMKLILDKEVINYRPSIIDKMLKHGLEAKIPDFRPIHKTELFKNYNLYSKYFPDETKVLGLNHNYKKAETYYDRLIGLPAFITEEIDLVTYYMETIGDIMHEISQLREAKIGARQEI